MPSPAEFPNRSALVQAERASAAGNTSVIRVFFMLCASFDWPSLWPGYLARLLPQPAGAVNHFLVIRQRPAQSCKGDHDGSEAPPSVGTRFRLRPEMSTE